MSKKSFKPTKCLFMQWKEEGMQINCCFPLYFPLCLFLHHLHHHPPQPVPLGLNSFIFLFCLQGPAPAEHWRMFYNNIYISHLTIATKCSRFMPGLLALVSASFSSDEIRKPAAFPAYPPWETMQKVRGSVVTQHVTSLNKQPYKTQVRSQSDVLEHTPRPLTPWSLCTDKGPCLLSSGWLKKRKQIKRERHSLHSYSSRLSAPNEGWSAIQDSSAVLGKWKPEIQY